MPDFAAKFPALRNETLHTRNKTWQEPKQFYKSHFDFYKSRHDSYKSRHDSYESHFDFKFCCGFWQVFCEVLANCYRSVGKFSVKCKCILTTWMLWPECNMPVSETGQKAVAYSLFQVETAVF